MAELDKDPIDPDVDFDNNWHRHEELVDIVVGDVDDTTVEDV